MIFVIFVNMDPVKKFIKHVKNECEAYNVDFIVRNAKSVPYGNSTASRVGGYFMGLTNRGELAVAKRSPKFLEIMVHEFCHLHQWAEAADVWVKSDASYVLVEEWLEFKTEVTNISKHLDVCMELELDCEKRAVEMIRKWKLPIDLNLYRKGANAYMYLWKYLKYTRRWPHPDKSPYKLPVIIDRMPSRFLKNYELTPELFKLYTNAGV